MGGHLILDRVASLKGRHLKILATRVQKFPGRGNRTYKGPGL